ncbi:MAG: NADH:flavin oxidoreductase [Pseudomonadota bacterium]
MNVFSPIQLAGLVLRNRVIKTATYEGMTPNGLPSAALIEHHRAIAAGGVAMTTVAYCSVSPDGRTFSEQMYIRPEVIPGLRHLTDAVHEAGGAVSLQLAHCGYFTKNETLTTRAPLAPSKIFNPYGLMKGLFYSKAMERHEMTQVAQEYATAATMAQDAGFDAIELHLGHGYLLSQFLSPWSNRRRDEYGGSLANRLRFPLEVLDEIRAKVGSSFPILCKTNLHDGFVGGSDEQDAIGIASALEARGADALVLSGGFVSRSAFYLMRGGLPLRGMLQIEKNWLQKFGMALFSPWLVKQYPFDEVFFLAQAKQVREAVTMPLVLLGGIVSLSNMEQAMQAGFDLVAVGRPLLHNPQFINQLRAGQITRSACNQCNQCVVEMDRGGVQCVLHPVRAAKTSRTI